MGILRTELHRHLDVSLRLSTLLELCQERGIEGQSTSLEAFRKKIVLTEPLENLSEVLGTFTIFQRVMDRPDVLARVAFEAVEDCFREGTRKVEFRFSPSFVCEKTHLSWKTVLDGFSEGLERGLNQHPEMKAGLICIASRDYGAEEVDKTVEFYLAHRDHFIGIDLAGNEDQFPCRLFEKSFQKALAQGAKITVHAGEASGPENVWEAITLLGAQRIGHGISTFKDLRLVEEVRKRQICLEMCPTSNWITQAVSTLEQHPLIAALRYDVPCSINTDDPTVFGVDLPHEIEICRTKLGLNPAQIARTFAYAERASFL